MNKTPHSRSFWKVVAFDALAGLCFIGVIAFGWLPGPGGIPLFILGLSLLAANHEWAERWLDTAKHKGVRVKEILFPNKPLVQMAYDCGSILLFAVSVYLLFVLHSRILEAGIAILMCACVVVFLLNRQRLDHLKSIMRKKS